MAFGTISNLTSGKSGTDPSTTASVTVKSGAVCYVTLASATDSGAIPQTDFRPNVTMTGLTFTKISGGNCVQYRVRRGITVWRAVNTGSDVTATIEVECGNVTGTFFENVWSVDQFENVDTTTPNDTVIEYGADSGTSATAADVGTPDAGDAVFNCFAVEESGTGLTIDSATALASVSSGTDVRQIRTGYDGGATPDETPGATWTDSGTGGAGFAFIVNAGTGGGFKPSWAARATTHIGGAF